MKYYANLETFSYMKIFIYIYEVDSDVSSHRSIEFFIMKDNTHLDGSNQARLAHNYYWQLQKGLLYKK